MWRNNLIFFLILLLIGSKTHAAETSPTSEIVSYLNEDRSFSCDGSNVKWFRHNSTQIRESSKKYQITTSENESILTVKQIDAMSLGYYKCISFIDDTRSEKYFHLKLYYPLTFTHIPRDYIVKENSDVTLKCKTVSEPRATIEWYFEQKELKPQEDYAITSDGISLMNIQVEQAGKYTCVATQELGSLKNIQQRSTQLIVEYGPKQTSSEPLEVTGNIGESVNLQCDAKSNPPPRFAWLKNKYDTYEDVTNYDDSSTLTVKIESEESYNDTYTCIANNDHGQLNQVFILKEQPIIEDTSDARRTAEITSLIAVLITALLMF